MRHFQCLKRSGRSSNVMGHVRGRNSAGPPRGTTRLWRRTMTASTMLATIAMVAVTAGLGLGMAGAPRAVRGPATASTAPARAAPDAAPASSTVARAASRGVAPASTAARAALPGVAPASRATKAAIRGVSPARRGGRAASGGPHCTWPAALGICRSPPGAATWNVAILIGEERKAATGSLARPRARPCCCGEGGSHATSRFGRHNTRTACATREGVEG